MVVAVLSRQGRDVLGSSAVVWQGEMEQSGDQGLLAAGMDWWGMGSSILGCLIRGTSATGWQMTAALRVLDVVAE